MKKIVLVLLLLYSNVFALDLINERTGEDIRGLSDKSGRQYVIPYTTQGNPLYIYQVNQTMPDIYLKNNESDTIVGNLTSTASMIANYFIGSGLYLTGMDYNNLINIPDSYTPNVATDTAEWNKINNIPNLLYTDSNIFSDSIVSLDFNKVVGDTITKTEINTKLNNLSGDSIVSGTVSNSYISDSYVKNYESDTINGSLMVNGSINADAFYGVLNKTVDTLTDTQTIADTSDYIIINNEEIITLTLPAVLSGKEITIKNITDTQAIILPASGNIDSDTNYTFFIKYESITVFSDGINWFIK